VGSNAIARALGSPGGGSNSLLNKLTEMTPMEATYNEQSKAVKNMTPNELQYLQHGILYYRVSR
jgi:hypothetical protein